MEANRGGTPNFEVQPPSSPEGEQKHEQSVEAAPARPEQVGKQAPKPIALPPAPDEIPAVDQPAVAVPPDDATKPELTDVHDTMPDNDRIDNVWINQVKNAAARTADDPYIQSSEMNKIKAQYKLQRFNKKSKTDEAAA